MGFCTKLKLILVQVQRTVSRQGKTFLQNFWVKPSQVKSTDRVIGGLLNNDWCVRDPQAVMPRYLVQIELL